jgi:hypothetical protein
MRTDMEIQKDVKGLVSRSAASPFIPVGASAPVSS